MAAGRPLDKREHIQDDKRKRRETALEMAAIAQSKLKGKRLVRINHKTLVYV